MGEAGRAPRTFEVVFTSRTGGAVRRSDFNTYAWKPALVAAGVIPPRVVGERYQDAREDGMHALRHFYASVLLDGGENIKALSAYLGHSDPGFTLRVYTHLMHDRDEFTRASVDRVFRQDRAARYAALLHEQVERAPLAIPDGAFQSDVAVVFLHGGRDRDHWSVGVPQHAAGEVFGRCTVAPMTDRADATWVVQAWFAAKCEQLGLTVLSSEDLSEQYLPAERGRLVLARAVVARRGEGAWVPRLETVG